MLGMVPRNLKVGDYVCVVHWVCVPIVVSLINDNGEKEALRKNVRVKYVTSGYFHEIMKGGIFKAAEESGKEVQVF